MAGQIQFGLGQFQSTSIAAAATTDLVTDVSTIRVRLEAGAGAIASFGPGVNKWRKVYVAAPVTIQHDASGDAGTIFCLTNDDIDAEAGDTFEVFSNSIGAWRVHSFQRGSGEALAAPSGYAQLDSPDFTGNPTAPTKGSSDNDTSIATTAFVHTAIDDLIAAAPGALNTLDELAAALGDDANFAATVATALADKLAKASNLSDLANAATSRTNLGVAIGSDVEAHTAFLSTLGALADYAAFRTAAGLVIGTDVQAYNPALAAFVGSTVWASRPSAASNTGMIILVTDVGVAGGSLWISDGVDWKPLGTVVIERSAVKQSIPNNALTTEQTYKTVTIPAGALGLNGGFFVDIGWTFTGSTNVKTMRARFNGTSGTQICSSAASSATFVLSRLKNTVRNRGVANSQIWPVANQQDNGTAGAAGVHVTNAVDTTAAVTVVITGQTATAGEVLDLEWYEVRLLP